MCVPVLLVRVTCYVTRYARGGGDGATCHYVTTCHWWGLPYMLILKCGQLDG